MLIRTPHLMRLAIFGVIACAVLMMLPRSAAVAAPAMAVYRGDVPAATGPGRKIELRLKADGTMSMISDYGSGNAAITEDGHWNPVSLEQIDLIIERKNGVEIGPNTLHFVKQGDVLQTTPESAAQYGSAGLQLRQTKAAAVVAPMPLPVAGPANANGSWRWEGLVTSADTIEIEQPERYTLELLGGGKAQVRADCNRGQAAYKLDGRAIAIKVSGMTRAACPPGSMSERYVKALEAAVGQRIRGNNLFLDLPGEGGTMRFVRAK
jgi:heat shock protein HslJ